MDEKVTENTQDHDIKASPEVQGHRETEDSAHPGASALRPDTVPPLLSCLETIFQLNGRSISVSSLLASLPVERGGFPPRLCVRAAEQSGMNAKIASRSSISKINPLTLPCILVLKNGNGCVLTGLDGDEADVLFPETPGHRRKTTLETLQENYTGRAIFVSPKGKLDRRAADIKLFQTRRWFWGTIGRFMPIYKHVILASIVINLLGIAGPLFVMNVYDRVVPNNAVDTLWVLAVRRTGIAIVHPDVVGV